MPQSVYGDLHPRTERSRARDAARIENIRDFNDSICGDNDGFLAESHAVIGGHYPANSNSKLHLKDPILGSIIDTKGTNSNTTHACGKSECSSQEITPLPNKTHQNSKTHHAIWKQASGNPKLKDFSSVFANMYPEDEIEGGANFTIPHELQDTRDSSETDTTAEIVGEVSAEQMLPNGQEHMYTETATRSTDGTWQGKGIGQWNRTTVLSLAVFVGLRLCYEVWFGKSSIFFQAEDYEGNDW